MKMIFKINDFVHLYDNETKYYTNIRVNYFPNNTYEMFSQNITNDYFFNSKISSNIWRNKRGNFRSNIFIW